MKPGWAWGCFRISTCSILCRKQCERQSCYSTASLWILSPMTATDICDGNWKENKTEVRGLCFREYPPEYLIQSRYQVDRSTMSDIILTSFSIRGLSCDMSLTRASSMAFHTSFVIMTMTMFGTHKDFAELAHQIALSSRGPTTDRSKNTIHINVYQIRLWKLIHTPDRNDLEALAEALQVCKSFSSISFKVKPSDFSSVINKSWSTPLQRCTIVLCQK